MADEPKWWWSRRRKQQWAAERQRVAQTLFYKASRTPAQRLLAASEDGDVASVAALLLDGSVDVDVREQDGWLERTPLHVAAINGQRDVVECLLRHGAAVDATSKTMQKPLHQLTREDIENVTLIIQASQTDTNPTAKGGWTALHWAARCGQAEAVKLLLKAQADPNAVDEDGQTPLHVACFVANRDVIRVLLGAGADLHAVTKGGFKPLHHCIRWTDHLHDEALHAMQLLTDGWWRELGRDL